MVVRVFELGTYRLDKKIVNDPNEWFLIDKAIQRRFVRDQCNENIFDCWSSNALLK